MRSLLEKRILKFLIGFTGILLLLTGLEVAGRISPLGFAYAVIIVSFVAWILLTMLIKRTPRESPTIGDDPVARKKILRAVRRYKLMIAVMLCALVYGLWETRSGPLFPRMTGVLINLAITGSLIRGLRVAKAERIEPVGFNPCRAPQATRTIKMPERRRKLRFGTPQRLAVMKMPSRWQVLIGANGRMVCPT
jgi:hypothetical protein